MSQIPDPGQLVQTMQRQYARRTDEYVLPASMAQQERREHESNFGPVADQFVQLERMKHMLHAQQSNQTASLERMAADLNQYQNDKLAQTVPPLSPDQKIDEALAQQLATQLSLVEKEDSLGPLKGRCVFIGNIPFSATAMDVLTEMTNAGSTANSIDQLRMQIDRTGRFAGYALCIFRNPAGAEWAVKTLHHRPMGIQPLRVQRIETAVFDPPLPARLSATAELGPPTPSPIPPPKSQRIVIRHLDSHLSYQELMDTLTKFGTVQRLEQQPNIHGMTCTYQTVAAAEQAVKELNGFRLYGRAMKVDFDTSPVEPQPALAPVPDVRPPNHSVFISNIPYDMSEQQLLDIMTQAGPVYRLHMQFDSRGKPVGYADCTFHTVAGANCAVKNLNHYEISGRSLRVDFSAAAESAPQLIQVPAPVETKHMAIDDCLTIDVSAIPALVTTLHAEQKVAMDKYLAATAGPHPLPIGQMVTTLHAEQQAAMDKYLAAVNALAVAQSGRKPPPPPLDDGIEDQGGQEAMQEAASQARARYQLMHKLKVDLAKTLHRCDNTMRQLLADQRQAICQYENGLYGLQGLRAAAVTAPAVVMTPDQRQYIASLVVAEAALKEVQRTHAKRGVDAGDAPSLVRIDVALWRVRQELWCSQKKEDDS